MAQGFPDSKHATHSHATRLYDKEDAADFMDTLAPTVGKETSQGSVHRLSNVNKEKYWDFKDDS